MLKFILGTAGSGKTHNIIGEIKRLTERGVEGAYLLVPEQYSFECEKMLIKTLGAAAANKVKVVSFTSLSREILTATGGLSAKIADESTRLILMGQAVESVSDKLLAYSSFSSNHGFALKLVKDITELKQAALTPEKLMECAEKVESKGLKRKLNDVSLIMASYDKLLSGKFIDPEDLTTVTAQKANDNNWFKGKHIFVDGFTGFTRSQYLLIEAAIKAAERAVFAFTVTNADKKCEDIFSNIRKEIEIVRSIASKYGVKEDAPLTLTSPYVSKGIRALDLLLRGETPQDNEDISEVIITECETKADEALFCAAEIRKIVREEGAFWRDFVVITGGEAGYEAALENAMKKHKVPIFISKKTPMCELALARFVSAVLDTVRYSYRTEDLLRYIKSGLCPLTDEEIDALENYVYVWNIKGKEWKQEWTKNPNGLYESRESAEKTAQKLEILNSLRKRVIAPIEKFESGIGGGAKGIVTALFTLINELKVQENLANFSKWQRDQGDYSAAAKNSGSWNSLISSLDRITYCYSDRPLTFNSFCDLITTSFKSESVGQIPKRTDEVVFGTAERIRPSRPKYVFVLGANYGVLPAGVSNTGLFSLSERNQMSEAGAMLPDRYLGAVCEQDYFFYTSVMSSSEKVYITYRTKNQGAEIKPNLAVSKMLKKLKINKGIYSFKAVGIEGLESYETGFSYAAANWENMNDELATLAQALNNNPEYSQKTKRLGKGITQTESHISNETASRLYSKDMYISPSRVEKYYSCPFSYFCSYGLGVSPRRRAELNSQIRGTVTHHVLECIIKKYRDSFDELTEEVAAKEIKGFIKDYFDKEKVDITSIDAASQIALRAVEEGLLEVVLKLAEEFRQSGFIPSGFEVPIGRENGVNPPKIIGENCTVKLNGSVDRVDIAEGEDKKYVRIIDYKTGTKKFSLSDVFVGLNMQMLLYLASIVEDRDKVFGEVAPAGILYDQPLPSPSENGFTLSRDGILTSDISALTLMEKELKKKYIPAKLKNDGELDAYSKVVSEENFDVIFKYIKRMTVNMGENLLKGHIEPMPAKTETTDGCKYCDFRAVCGMEQHDREISDEKRTNQEIIELMKEEVEK